MEAAEQTSRGGLHPIVFNVFCGVGEWAPTAASDLQDDEEDAVQADHPVYLQPFGVHYGREILAHHPAAIPGTGPVLDRPHPSSPEGGSMGCSLVFFQ